MLPFISGKAPFTPKTVDLYRRVWKEMNTSFEKLRNEQCEAFWILAVRLQCMQKSSTSWNESVNSQRYARGRSLREQNPYRYAIRQIHMKSLCCLK